MLLLAESSDQGKRMFSAGLPTLETGNKAGNYLQVCVCVCVRVCVHDHGQGQYMTHTHTHSWQAAS